jgi:hypothetical protein
MMIVSESQSLLLKLNLTLLTLLTPIYAHGVPEVQGMHMLFFYANVGDCKSILNEDDNSRKMAYRKGGILRNRTSGEGRNGEWMKRRTSCRLKLK